MLFKIEADATGHQEVEDWINKQRLVGSCGLSTPLFSSGIDFKRNTILTRASLRSRARSVREFEVSSLDDAILFKATFSGLSHINLM